MVEKNKIDFIIINHQLNLLYVYGSFVTIVLDKVLFNVVDV